MQLSHVSFAVPDRRFAGIYELAFAERAGVDLSNAVVWTPDGEARHLPVASGSETRLALESFLRCVSTGEHPQASAEAGFEAAVAALLCCRAIEQGRTVEWEEVAPDGAPSSLA